MRGLVFAAILAALRACGPTPAWATVYYVDGTAGLDSNNGKGRPTDPNPANRPWKTWGKILLAGSAGTLLPDDLVLVRPGIYVANGQRWTANGGTSGHPITVSVDSSYTGDVAVYGVVQAGVDGIGTWRQAHICSAGPNARVPCDDTTGAADASRCGGQGSTCDVATGVYYLVASISSSYMNGVAFQAPATPGGAACSTNPDAACAGPCDTKAGRCMPKFAELLYAPEGAPVVMPAFTAGRFQAWPYKEIPVNNNGARTCTALRTPWACCTGLGVGITCITEPRMYVQMANGLSPGSASIPVFVTNHVPLGFGTAHDVTFTNNGNGREFFIHGAPDVVLYVGPGSARLKFEDVDLAYNSMASAIARSTSNPWINSGSAWPRDNGGPMRIYEPAPDVRTVEIRRFRIHHNGGDEGARGQGHTFEDGMFYELPWEVENGSGHTTDSPLNTVDVYGYSTGWPPTGYRAAWANVYPNKMSPLGGGGQTAGVGIFGDGNILRRLTASEINGAPSFETNGATGNVLEDSRFDCAYTKWHGNMAAATSQTAFIHPNQPVGICDEGPLGNCNSYQAEHCLASTSGALGGNKAGNIFRNIELANCYGTCVLLTDDATDGSRQISPRLVNFSVDLKGPMAYRDPFAGAQISLGTSWGTAAGHGVIENWVVQRSGTQPGTSFALTDPSLAFYDIDYNLWGPGQSWSAGGLTTATFSGWRANLATAGCVNCEATAHSSQVANVGFTAGTDLHLTAASPAVDTGVCLADVTHDVEQEPRPMGLSAACDKSADERNQVTPPTSTSTSSSTTTSTSTSRTTSTSTSTTLPGGVTSSTSTSTSTSTSRSTTSSSTTATSTTSTSRTTLPVSSIGVRQRGTKERGGKHGPR